MFAELKNKCNNCGLFSDLKQVAAKESARLSDVTDRLPNVDLPQDWSVKKVGQWADQRVSGAVKGIKNTNIPDKVYDMMPVKKPAKKRKCSLKGILILSAIALAVVGLAVYISRKLKESSAADGFNDFNYTTDAQGEDDQTFDFDHASLDELEAALLAVESDLNDITDQLAD